MISAVRRWTLRTCHFTVTGLSFFLPFVNVNMEADTKVDCSRSAAAKPDRSKQFSYCESRGGTNSHCSKSTELSLATRGSDLEEWEMNAARQSEPDKVLSAAYDESALDFRVGIAFLEPRHNIAQASAFRSGSEDLMALTNSHPASSCPRYHITPQRNT